MELHGSNGGAAALLLLAGEGEETKKWTDELVRQARGGVHIVAGRARTPAARGSVVNRPATGGATWRSFSENGHHYSLPETLIQLTDRPDSETSSC